MTPERWDYLKNLKPSPGRWLVLHTRPNRQQRRCVPAIPGTGNSSAKKPKTLEDTMYAGLSKRQKRKTKKMWNYLNKG